VVTDRFEWDDWKAAQNEKNHGIPFEIAEEVFDDPLQITIHDRFHSESKIATSLSARLGSGTFWSSRMPSVETAFVSLAHVAPRGAKEDGI
jgi:hypothetical protein